MSLLSPPLTKDDFINSGWQDGVNGSERKDCSTYSRAFFKKSQQAEEAGNLREQSVFRVLAHLTSVAIKPDSTEEFFAEAFKGCDLNLI